MFDLPEHFPIGVNKESQGPVMENEPDFDRIVCWCGDDSCRLHLLRTVKTVNSVYEVNEAEHLIRRVSGVNDPTPRQGADGDWRVFASIAPFRGGLLIMWDAETGKCTWTSDVVSDVTM